MEGTMEDTMRFKKKPERTWRRIDIGMEIGYIVAIQKVAPPSYINGNFRILKWRYCTVLRPHLWGYSLK